MLFIRYRWKGKCPRHPRFDPRKHGEAAIKGGCSLCRMLLAVYAAHRKTIEHATIFDEIDRVGAVSSNIRSAAVRAFGEKAS